jgi:DNA-binding MarR family transcriptional regulator
MGRAPIVGQDAELFELAGSISHLLHRAAQLANDRFTELVGDPVTLRQFEVLAAIAELPGLSQSELVRVTGVDRSTLADMLNRMERRDWITRTAAPLDGRALSVRLAAAGADIFRTTMPHAIAANAAVLDLLPRTKRRVFFNILSKLSKLADEAAERAEREAKRQAKRERREQKAKAKAPKSQARRKRIVARS